jgi:hypothetical protein
MRAFLMVAFALFGYACFSQTNTFYVEPVQTDINFDADQDDHLVVRNSATNNNKLFLFLGGTGSRTKAYLRISEFAGDLGYDVINLAYPNEVAAASLRNATDNLAFDHYRQEICYGTPLSDAVDVDSLNSINSRTIKLLNYLSSSYPAQSWDQYLSSPNTLDWSKIAIGGHSQGGGHAGYFAKLNNVERVLMLSSPNDFSEHFSQPANWLRIPGITPVDKHFAYLSLLDEAVDFSKQFSNLEDLGLYPLYDTIYVDNSSIPFDNSHFLYTTQAPGIVIFHHNSTVKFSALNNSVWEYMLTNEVTSSVNEQADNRRIAVFPNPTTSDVSIIFERDLHQKDYFVRNTNGQTILVGRTTESNILTISLSSFDNGIYFVSIENQTFKIIKQ